MLGKKWWIFGLVLVLAAGIWGGLRLFHKKDTQLTSSLNTTQVRKGTIEVKVSGTGSIQPSARQTLKASTAGTALKVNVKEGDKVKKGDILITYEQEDVADQIRSKEIDVKKKSLELLDLQTKYKEALDDESRESLTLSIQKQQLDIELAQADISSLQTSKSIDPIIAPIDGTLATFGIQAGDSISPNGDIGEIVNFASLQMVVGIDELDIPKVKLGQDAQILVEALPDDEFTGKVTAIADEGTTSNGVATFDVTIELAETNNLKVGMSAESSIMTNKKTDALYVPVEAVQSAQGKYFVMVPSSEASGQPTQQGQKPQSDAPSQNGQLPNVQSDQVAPNGNSERFQNMSDEEREAMREQFMANRGTRVMNTENAANVTTTRVEVEVGINNEDHIEIVSGLKEGDRVILPTVAGSSTGSNMQAGFPGMGIGGIPGGGASFQGGGGRSTVIQQPAGAGGGR